MDEAETKTADNEIENQREGAKEPGEDRTSLSLGLLIFIFGLSGGFLAAYSALDIIEDSYKLIIGVMIALLLFLVLIAFAVYIWRKTLMNRLFGIVETQIESFAGPLSDVARGAANRDPDSATSAARLLIHRALARYAWMSTRRWVIASLTGLIAAMAAFAGTTLLFRQNQLIAVQSELLAEQNSRIAEQTALLKQDVELAEAARNAELAVEITNIGALLGKAVEKKRLMLESTSNSDVSEKEMVFPELDPLVDLSPSLIIRTAAASRSVKPYRFLETPLRDAAAEYKTKNLQYALLKRRDDLTQTYEDTAKTFGWEEWGEDGLTASPVSPERGQILETLFLSGVRAFETFALLGTDFSFAYAPNINLFDSSFQVANLSFADMSSSNITRVDFRGATLGSTLFHNARIEASQFGTIAESKLKRPLKNKGSDVIGTKMPGVDFSQAFLVNNSFAGSGLGAANFDDSALIGNDFSGTIVVAATFRNALLLGNIWQGVILNKTDLDGALVFTEDFLINLEKVAATPSSISGMFQLVPANLDDVSNTIAIAGHLSKEQIIELAGGDKVWRIKRVKPLEEPKAKETSAESES